MHLKVLLPFQVFVDSTQVQRVVAETLDGSFGLLEHRLDCVAALVPGILTYQRAGEEETFVAVDEGVLVKTGADVLISVRRAVSGTDLGRLRSVVEKQFSTLNEQERNARLATRKLETGFLSRFSAFQHG